MRMHQCPVKPCDQQVPNTHLMCRRHWFRVPRPLRDEVRRTYRAKDWADHRRACVEAIAFVSAEEEESA